MEKTIISTTQVPVINLDTARKAVVNVVGKTGELLQTYANALCQHFNLVDNQGKVTTPWYDLQGKDGKAVEEERKKFKAAMESAGFDSDTANTYWGRVKDKSGRVKTKNKVTSKVDVDAENVKALKTILNRIDTTEPESAPMSFKVVKLLVQAADLMGVDVSAYAIGRGDE